MATTTPPTPTPNDALNALVLTAMMQALSQQSRDELIRKALETLIKPKGEPQYGRPPPTSPLQDAFDYAVYQVAREIVGEMVQGEEIRTKIRELCSKAVEKAMANSEDITNRMANALAGALTR